MEKRLEIISKAKFLQSRQSEDFAFLLDDDDGYLSPSEMTEAEINAQRNVKNLCRFMANETKVNSNKLWENFIYTIKFEKNKKAVSHLASNWIVKFVEEKNQNKMLHDLITEMKRYFKNHDIRLHQNVVKYLNQKKQESIKRHKANKPVRQELKWDQYHHCKSVLPKLLDLLGSGNLNKIRGYLYSYAYKNTTPKGSRNKITPVANLDDDDLKVYLLMLRAFVAIGMCTGLRSIAFFRLTMNDVNPTDGSKEGVLLSYVSEKNGGNRATPITKKVRIIFNNDTNRCALTALSEYFTGLKFAVKNKIIDESKLEHPFTLGYKCSNTMSKERIRGFHGRLRDKLSSVLVALSHSLGEPYAFSYKKLHAFRSYVTYVLSENGIERHSTNVHLGWTCNTVQSHYVNENFDILNCKAPFVMASRYIDGSVTPCPPQWNTIQYVHGIDIIEKIINVASAAKSTSSLFNSLVNIRVNEATRILVVNRIRQHNNTKKRKRKLADVVQENKELKLKLFKVDPSAVEFNKDEIRDQLLNIVESNKQFSKQDNFPQLCYDLAKDKIAPLLDKIGAPNERSLGLEIDLSRTKGRNVINTLRLAVALKQGNIHNCKRKSGCCWLSYTRNSSSEFKTLHRVSATSWSTFRKFICFNN